MQSHPYRHDTHTQSQIHSKHLKFRLLTYIIAECWRNNYLKLSLLCLCNIKSMNVFHFDLTSETNISGHMDQNIKIRPSTCIGNSFVTTKTWKELRWMSRLRLEYSNNANDVTTANGAFAQNLSACGASDRVTALQEDTFDGRIHTNLAQIVGRQFLRC